MNTEELENLMSENIIEDEKIKIINMLNHNNEIINKIDKFNKLLNQVEISINDKIEKQITDFIELQRTFQNNNEIFKNICKNLI